MNRSALLLAAVVVAAVAAVVVLRPQAGRWHIVLGESAGKEVIVAVDTATGWTYWREPGVMGWTPVPPPK